ncbi:MAG: OFA family MFS transporter [Oscillospiraceae bacterium]
MKINKNRYVVLVAGMLIQLFAGIIYMWSVFKGPVLEFLKVSKDDAKSFGSMTSSVMLASFVIGIMVGGKIQDKIGPRIVVISGSSLIGLGMLATWLFIDPSRPSLIHLTYGVLGGIGVGFVYTTAVSVVQKWFADKRGFATGMMVSAFGFSLVVFTPFTKWLLSDKGVPNTFLILGILYLVVCLTSSMFIANPPADFAAKPSASGGAPSTAKHYTTLDMLKTPQFYLIAVGMMLILPAYFILNPQFITLGKEKDLSEAGTTALVMVTGVASASGRLLFSWLSDVIGRKKTIIAIIITTIAAVLLLIPATGALFFICVGAIAFAFGGSAGVFPALTADNFGTKHMGMNYGCIMVGFGISALVFPQVSQRLPVDHGHAASFILAASTCVISLVLILLLKRTKQED